MGVAISQDDSTFYSLNTLASPYGLSCNSCTCPNLFDYNFLRNGMSEAGQMLDLNQMDKTNVKLLTPINSNDGWTAKSPHKIVYPAIILSIISWIIRSPFGLLEDFVIKALLALSVYLIVKRSSSIRDVYQIIETGIKIPHSWLTHTTLTWDEIVRVDNTTLVGKIESEKIDAIEITVDTSKLGFNVSGLTESIHYIPKDRYYKDDWSDFSTALQQAFRSSMVVPNTLAERLEKQVNRAWQSRWKHFLFKTIDSSIEVLLYILALELILTSIFAVPLFQAWIFWLIGFQIIVTIAIRYSEIPRGIIGIRPNELGPLMYNHNELVTNVRLMGMAFPSNIKILHGEMIYPEGEISQSERIKQIEPKEIEMGQFKHIIIQVWGNHTKARGIKLFFKYIDNKDEQEYELEQLWA